MQHKEETRRCVILIEREDERFHLEPGDLNTKTIKLSYQISILVG